MQFQAGWPPERVQFVHLGKDGPATSWIPRWRVAGFLPSSLSRRLRMKPDSSCEYSKSTGYREWTNRASHSPSLKNMTDWLRTFWYAYPSWCDEPMFWAILCTRWNLVAKDQRPAWGFCDWLSFTECKDCGFSIATSAGYWTINACPRLSGSSASPWNGRVPSLRNLRMTRGLQADALETVIRNEALRLRYLSCPSISQDGYWARSLTHLGWCFHWHALLCIRLREKSSHHC